MSYLGIPVLGGKHLTLVHFPGKVGTQQVLDVLHPVTARVKKKPSGLYTMPFAAGPRRNVQAMEVDSKYVRELRAYLVGLLLDSGIKYSEDYEYRPHVTGVKADPGTPVPFEPWIEFRVSGGVLAAAAQLGE